MQSIELKQNMTREDEPRFRITARGVGRKRVITRHVRMHDLDSIAPHKPVEHMRAPHVESVSQRQSHDSIWRQVQVSRYRRVRTHCDVQLVSAINKCIREIGKITLAAAERRS